MFVVVTILAVPLGWVEYQLNWIRQRHAFLQRDGVVQTVDYLLFRPADFQLSQDASPHAAVVCYLEGNKSQLDALLGRRVQIEGREYWVQKLRYAIVVPEVITPLPQVER